jgi:hypothetical protein
MASPVLEPIYMAPPGIEDAAAEPILDESGNPIRDEKGNVIYEG